MAELIRDLMTKDIAQLDVARPVSEAARHMREADVGDVLVTRQGRLCGIVTDRDIVVRCVAEGQDPTTTPVERVCTREIATLAPEEDADHAVALMRERAVRRVPVVQGDQLVGILSIGDLARVRDDRSVLGQISAAPSNN